MKVCPKCKKEARIITRKVCHNCYRKYIWKPKLIKCKRCNRTIRNHAFGFCIGCYSSVFHIDKIMEHQTKKRYGLSKEQYDGITKKCVLCGFDKIVDLHHLDHNSKNNSRENMLGVCPNHHKMLHHRDFRHEIFGILEEKGFKCPKPYKKDAEYKSNLERTIHKKKLANLQNQTLDLNKAQV